MLAMSQYQTVTTKIAKRMKALVKTIHFNMIKSNLDQIGFDKNGIYISGKTEEIKVM